MGLGVVLRIDVEISDSVPVTVKVRRAVLRLAVDKVFAALCVIVDREIGLGEMALPGKPSHKLSIKVCPVFDQDLKGSVKECPGMNGIVEFDACQISDGARFWIHWATFELGVGANA